MKIAKWAGVFAALLLVATAALGAPGLHLLPETVRGLMTPAGLDGQVIEYPTEIRTYTWMSGWEITSRATASVDGQGRITSLLLESTTDDGQTWEPENRIDYTWGSALGPDTETSYDWDGSSWDPISRTTYTYDGSGNILTEIVESYFVSWENVSRTTITRDGSGNPLEELTETWISGAWANSGRILYTYNGSLLETEQNYFWLGSSWMLTSRSVYSYSGSLETEELVQTWTGVSWFDSQRYTTTYSGSQADTYLYELWNGIAWQATNRDVYESYDGQGRVLAINMQLANGAAFDNSSRIEYDWGTPTAIGDDLPVMLPNGMALHQNYPNPFNPSTVIEFSLPVKSHVRVTVHDVLGREIAELHSGALPAGVHTVDWHGVDRTGQAVSTGVYFYRVLTDDGSLARKMLLLK